MSNTVPATITWHPSMTRLKSWPKKVPKPVVDSDDAL